LEPDHAFALGHGPGRLLQRVRTLFSATAAPREQFLYFVQLIRLVELVIGGHKLAAMGPFQVSDLTLELLTEEDSVATASLSKKLYFLVLSI